MDFTTATIKLDVIVELVVVIKSMVVVTVIVAELVGSFGLLINLDC